MEEELEDEEVEDEELLDELVEDEEELDALLELEDEASPPLFPPQAPKKPKQASMAIRENLFIMTPEVR